MEVNHAVNGRISDTRAVRMAFNGFQGTSSGSALFSADKQQTCGAGDNGRLLQPFLPSPIFSVQEEPGMSYTPWSAHDDDPYQLIECTQNSKSRNLTDGMNCGSEADLYGLVSNILEEPDQMDSYYTDEKTPFSLKSVWSSKPMREQYFQAESEMLPNSAFLPSHAYPEPFSTTPGQPISRDAEELYQHFTGLDSSEHWLFSSCNGELDTYSPQGKEVSKPMGLHFPAMGNSSMSKMRPGKHEYSTAEKVGGLCGPVNTHMDAFSPQSKMNSHGFDHYYEDYTGQPRRTRQYAMQGVNKLASNIQALMVGDQDNTCAREVQSKQNAQMQYEDSLADQRRFTSSRGSTHSTPTMQFHKEVGGNFGALQQDTDGAGRKQPLQSEFGSKDLSGFGPQHVEYFQQPKAPSVPLNHPNSYQNKFMEQKANNPISANMNLNQFTSRCQQNQGAPKPPRSNSVPSASKISPHSGSEFRPQQSHQIQRGLLSGQEFSQGDGTALHSHMGQGQAGTGVDGLRECGDRDVDKNRMPVSGLAGEGFSTQRMDGKTARPHTGGHTREGDKRQGLLHNPYLDLLGSMYSAQRFGGANGNVNAGKMPLFLPYVYPGGDLRQNSYHLPTAVRPSGFNPRSSLPYGGSFPLVDLCDLLPDGEFAAFNPYDLMGTSAEGPYSALSSALRSPRTRSRGGPMSQLHFHLEECYEQWRFLEKERKKTEVILTNSYPVRRISVVSNSAFPKVPPNPSRVDHLIVDQIREQTRVVSLLGEMERLHSFPFHANIGSALDRHQEAIYITQARREEEFVNTSSRQRQGGAHFREDRDILLLAMALRDLCVTTRKSRTAMWCALQMTLPKTSEDQLDEQRGPL